MVNLTGKRGGSMAKFAVILPAAGAGKRFGGNVKKPFAKIEDRPIFIRSIELFIQREDVCETHLTVAPDDYAVVKEKYAANIMFMGFKLVQGGSERFDSVRKALANLSDDAEYVCIHDAVRPCVLESWIDEVFAEAQKTGAAILATPLGRYDQTGQRGGCG
jgi:2-C-methyl-D-erythritol 4-phosphate cytidylyltransferase